MKSKPFLTFLVPLVLTAGLAAAGEGRVMKSTSPAAVAPVFEHGDGKGAVGADVKTPAVFLPADDAIEIVKDDLAQAGLKLSERHAEMREVMIPERRDDLQKIGKEWKEDVVEIAGQTSLLTADLLDPRKKVAVVCVTKDNYFKLGGAHAVLPYQFYDFKGVAEFVAGHVVDAGKGVYFGVFYDPMARPDSKLAADDVKPNDRHAFEAAAREESKRLLKEQVKDFVAWLKEQGVL